MTDSYVYIITALLPLTAAMVVFQVNPYHALIIRGILGAVAALVYAVLGAADVALTEALVGTMLAITLYAVAVRSSLVVRLGVLQAAEPQGFQAWVEGCRAIFSKHYMRLELVDYPNDQDLHQALNEKEVHAIYLPQNHAAETVQDQALIRIPRLYEIMQAELTSPETTLTYVAVADLAEAKV
ncbi:DUF4040 domain-containing protein [Acaryochloris marina]|uniref:DUF4040 domain-containing protein n=1 Tax=Acaryochloris marina TaxID=155978 RepID=UPI001BB00CCE|nr:DUF4040 domain-containing protein [Acaryochloris marina]QUY42697.1 DUF4040 domain-containing protein [Acaryochloris marina S15]